MRVTVEPGASAAACDALWGQLAYAVRCARIHQHAQAVGNPFPVDVAQDLAPPAAVLEAAARLLFTA